MNIRIVPKYRRGKAPQFRTTDGQKYVPNNRYGEMAFVHNQEAKQRKYGAAA